MYYLIALFMGLSIATQAPINAALAKTLGGSPLIAALISFVVGSICLCAICYVSGALNIATLKAIPMQVWWKFLGGILGAFFVFGTILLAPKIGLINMFLLVLLGQLVTSMILDSIGAFGLDVKPISWYKIIGLCVMFAGLAIFFYKELKGG